MAPPSQPSRSAWAKLQSDERLVRRAKKGERRAFEAIFERYHQDIYRFCLTLVGSRQDAEDALQATMVKMLRSLPGEQRDIKLRPWIYKIARNESIDTIRRRRETTALVPEQITSGPGLVETAEARERLGKLIDDLGELPERQRSALVMRELGDLEFAEIGSALETSAEVARQTVYEARVSLRQMEAGREMSCDEVIWAISDGDGRVVRRREIQAHLRGCPDCRAFQTSIVRRRGELRAIAPLPVAASATLLQGAFGAGSGAAGGGVAGAAGAGAGKALVTSAVVKTAATCAVVAAIGATAADRSGLVNVPLGGSDGGVAKESAPPSQSAPAQSPQLSRRGSGSTSAPAAGRPTEGRLHPGVAAAARPSGNQSGGGRTGTETPASTAGSPPSANSGANGNAGGAGSKKNATKRAQGKAQGLPSSSAKGQQTAAAHKSPHANANPGTPRGSGNGQSSPPPPPAQPPAEPAPEREAPAYGKSGNAEARGKANPPAADVEMPESGE
jgi:RNA polymerase sigma factor (sigma-70 family)